MDGRRDEETYEEIEEHIRLRAIQEGLKKQDVAFLLTLIDPRKSPDENRRRVEDEIEVVKGENIRASLKSPHARSPERKGRRTTAVAIIIVALVGSLAVGLFLGSALAPSGPVVLPLTSKEVLVVMPPGAGENLSLPKSQSTLVGWGYEPDVVHVVIGVNSTVVWVNEDRGTVFGMGVSVPHTVTNPQGLFYSGVMNAGDQFTHTFTSPGTYYYHCIYHPWMKGEVVVTAPQNP